MANKKFSDFTAYTIASLMASPSSGYIYLVGHNEFTDENIKVPFNDFLAEVAGIQLLDNVTLSEASTYQNDSLIGATVVWAFFAGEHMNTSNLITSFNSTTGTIVFNSSFTPLDGEINILYKAS